VCVSHYHCAQLSYIIQHTTVLIIFPLILQTMIIAQMMSTGGQELSVKTPHDKFQMDIFNAAFSWNYYNSLARELDIISRDLLKLVIFCLDSPADKCITAGPVCPLLPRCTQTATSVLMEHFLHGKPNFVVHHIQIHTIWWQECEWSKACGLHLSVTCCILTKTIAVTRKSM